MHVDGGDTRLCNVFRRKIKEIFIEIFKTDTRPGFLDFSAILHVVYGI